MKGFKQINQVKLCELIDVYASNWGSLSKREFEARLFAILIESNVISSNIYDIMSKLCVTRQKARNLLYEYNLRKYNSDSNQQSCLLNELFDMLFNPIISEDENCKTIKLQVENPYMIDYVKNIFAQNRILVDGSFSPDIITINKNEFMYLFAYCCINEKDKSTILKKKGIYFSDDILHNISEICSSVANKFLDKFGEKAVEKLFQLFEKTKLSDKVRQLFQTLFKPDNK